MLSLVIGLVAIVVVAYMIVKGYKPQAVLLFGGILLLFLTYATSLGIVLPEDQSTGFPIFDIFETIKNTFSSTAGGLGLIIMAVGGFAKYMEAIGASGALVRLSTKPLKKVKSPYVLIPISYLIGQALSIFVSSASGLGVLLMVTMYPILVSLGVSKLAATALIGSSASLDLGPADGNSNLAASVSDMSSLEYFASYQMPVALVAMIVIAALHYMVQVYYDKKQGLYMTGDPDLKEVIEEGSKKIKKGSPKIYAILPLLPLVFLLVFSEFLFESVSVSVVTSMLISFFVAITFEIIRTRDVKKVFASIQIYFDGMGKQFADVITLIVGGQVFAAGLIQIGFIDLIISKAQGAQLGAEAMTIIMVLIIAFSGVIMGSGNAPFFAFASLAPEVAAPLGVPTVFMALPMQLVAGLARSLSPIAGVIIAVSGISGVDTVDVVKRTAIPMIGGIITVLIATFLYV